MANSNCLAGIRCPECGAEDRFRIEASSIFEFDDEGSGDHEDVEWGDGSYIQCQECQHEGTVKEFTLTFEHEEGCDNDGGELDCCECWENFKTKREQEVANADSQ